VLGRQLQDLFPLAFLPSHHALAVAIMSYNGGVDYGLLADYDALPDLDLIAEGIDTSLQELLHAARARTNGEAPRSRPRPAATNGSPVPILPSGERRQRGPAADMRAAKRTRGDRPHGKGSSS
jgi:hypothetical protein